MCYRRGRRSIWIELVEDVEALGAAVLTLDDPDYPALLRELPDAPPVLYVKGTLLDVDQWAVAFVGTRRATVYGRDMTHELVIGAGRRGDHDRQRAGAGDRRGGAQSRAGRRRAHDCRDGLRDRYDLPARASSSGRGDYRTTARS